MTYFGYFAPVFRTERVRKLSITIFILNEFSSVKREYLVFVNEY